MCVEVEIADEACGCDWEGNINGRGRFGRESVSEWIKQGTSFPWFSGLSCFYDSIPFAIQATPERVAAAAVPQGPRFGEGPGAFGGGLFGGGGLFRGGPPSQPFKSYYTPWEVVPLTAVGKPTQVCRQPYLEGPLFSALCMRARAHTGVVCICMHLMLDAPAVWQA
jgi:hypothetical protein